MTTDIHPETEGPSLTHQPQSGVRQSHIRGVRRSRWLAASLLAMGLLGAIGASASFPGGSVFSGSRTALPLAPDQLHTITRGELVVTVTEQGTLESSNNKEIKCKVRGDNTVTWVIESGTEVQPEDELVRLDTLLIEEQISERTKFAHLARSVAERSKADVAKAKLAISEYEEGRYVSELATLEKDLAIFESNLSTAQNMLDHAEMMSESGYVSSLEVEEKKFAVTRAKLDVEVKNTEIDVLKRFTKLEELETLKGNLNATIARHEADKERAYAEALRRDRALEEYQYCVVKAERSGMVIHPSAAAWKDAPEIEEGATVHKDQVLLLMPDLTNMQVKVGIHESMIDDVQPGFSAKITLPDKTMYGEISSVASVAQPAGWWTGNVVKYDTMIQLPSIEGLKPGMTAEVEVILARHEDVLLVPVMAVVEMDEGYVGWTRTAKGVERRVLKLGDASEMFIVVQDGLQEGDEVILNPLTFIEAAQTEAARTLDNAEPRHKDRAKATGMPGERLEAEIDHVD